MLNAFLDSIRCFPNEDEDHTAISGTTRLK